MIQGPERLLQICVRLAAGLMLAASTAWLATEHSAVAALFGRVEVLADGSDGLRPTGLGYLAFFGSFLAGLLGVLCARWFGRAIMESIYWSYAALAGIGLTLLALGSIGESPATAFAVGAFAVLSMAVRSLLTIEHPRGAGLAAVAAALQSIPVINRRRRQSWDRRDVLGHSAGAFMIFLTIGLTGIAASALIHIALFPDRPQFWLSAGGSVVLSLLTAMLTEQLRSDAAISLDDDEATRENIGMTLGILLGILAIKYVFLIWIARQAVRRTSSDTDPS